MARFSKKEIEDLIQLFKQTSPLCPLCDVPLGHLGADKVGCSKCGMQGNFMMWNSFFNLCGELVSALAEKDAIEEQYHNYVEMITNGLATGGIQCNCSSCREFRSLRHSEVEEDGADYDEERHFPVEMN